MPIAVRDLARSETSRWRVPACVLASWISFVRGPQKISENRQKVETSIYTRHLALSNAFPWRQRVWAYTIWIVFFCCIFLALNQWISVVIGEQKTLKNKTLSWYLGGAGGRWKKIELPILRRYSGGSDGGPKSGIVYTTARFWWFQWVTKKWNRLYYGEILVAPKNDQKVKLPILRWDPGG